MGTHARDVQPLVHLTGDVVVVVVVAVLGVVLWDMRRLGQEASTYFQASVSSYSQCLLTAVLYRSVAQEGAHNNSTSNHFKRTCNSTNV